MRTGGVVSGVVIALAACGSSSAAPSPARAAAAQCGPRAAETLAVDHVARIYQAGGSVYGCTDATGHRYLLAANASRPGQPHIGALALAGVDAAYGETTSGVDTATATVTVRRLSDGRTLRSLAALSQPVGPEAFQTVNSVVVKKDGAVAWIATAHSIIHNTDQIEVDKAAQGGHSMLDTGSDIDSTSLRLRGSALTWLHGGATRTGTLD